MILVCISFSQSREHPKISCKQVLVTTSKCAFIGLIHVFIPEDLAKELVVVRVTTAKRVAKERITRKI